MSNLIVLDHDCHKKHVGRIGKLTELGVELEAEYVNLFGLGYVDIATRIFRFCKYFDMFLVLIDEPPFKRNGVVWYCFKLIGKDSTDDWYWFTLDQIEFTNPQNTIQP